MSYEIEYTSIEKYINIAIKRAVIEIDKVSSLTVGKREFSKGVSRHIRNTAPSLWSLFECETLETCRDFGLTENIP